MSKPDLYVRVAKSFRPSNVTHFRAAAHAMFFARTDDKLGSADIRIVY